MKKLLLFLLFLLPVLTNATEVATKPIHTDGLLGQVMTVSTPLGSGTNIVFVVPAEGEFYLTGFYSNTIAPNYSKTDLSVSNFGYIITAGQTINAPILIMPNQQMLCSNPDEGTIGLSCTITGIYVAK